MSGTDTRPVVLVVDDTPTNLKVISTMLHDAGFRVLLKKDGPSALALVGTRPPDLILLDVMMPGMDGYEVCRLLKDDPSTRDIPVIFMSALSDIPAKVRGFQAGGFDYIPKPFQFEEVLARVNVHLELRQARREIERRNAFIKKAFGRYVSDDVVETLLDDPDGLRLGGQERRVTVLFGDLRGFSVTCERLGPEQTVRLLNCYLGAMAEVVRDHGGIVESFQGDGILALFGAPVQRPGDALRAVRCAVQMQRTVLDVNRTLAEQGLPPIEMGIGLNTDEVVVGNVGSERRTNYTVVGTGVNLACRVEAYTVGGQVLVTEATAAEAGPTLQPGRRFSVRPKGLAEPVTVLEVLGLDDGPQVPPAPGTHLQPLAAEVPVEVVLLTGKDASGRRHPGAFRQLAPRRALLHLSEPLAPHDDLAFWLRGMPGLDDVQGFGKVVEVQPSGCLVHFTALPPALERAIAAHLSSEETLTP